MYSAVLNAQYAVMDALKPGVPWADMHALAYRTALTTLRDGGLLKGDVDAMMAVNLGATFMPHGLGHHIGVWCGCVSLWWCCRCRCRCRRCSCSRHTHPPLAPLARRFTQAWTPTTSVGTRKATTA